MKFLAVLCLLTSVACRFRGNEPITRLLTEQKRLKDSTNDLNKRIGHYMQKGFYDSANTQKIQLNAVHARLTDLQSSIDNRSK
jgi:hypothetical protein